MKLGFTRSKNILANNARPAYFVGDKFVDEAEFQFAQMARHAADTGEVAYSDSVHRVKDSSQDDADTVVSELKSFGLRKLAVSVYHTETVTVFVNDNSFLKFEHNREDHSASVGVITTDFALYEAVQKLPNFVAEIPKTKTRGTMVTMVTRSDPTKPLRARTVRIPKRSLSRQNYTPDTIKAWDRVASDLQSEDPNGRIAIFHGPPGTGKTHLIRGFMSAGINGTFVIIPPKEIGNIGDPEMIDLLIEIQDDYEGRIILVIEDADEILSTRKATSMSALANALNLGDGLMGDAVNAFIIATTNSPLGEIDPAILRPGRLSVTSEVPNLPTAQAQEVFKSIGGGGDLPSSNAVESYSLAEIYAAARTPKES